MQFDYRYLGETNVQNNAEQTGVSFAPDTRRQPTFFDGRLAQKLPFREAMSALHQVVVSDLRFAPKDRTDYFNWLKENEPRLLAEFINEETTAQGNVDERITVIRDELADIGRQMSVRMKPYRQAERRYFEYLYKYNRDAWYVLDPVITIHPDELFFECFSRDESSYGRLSCDFNVFEQMGEFACGTTNVDYSQQLYDEFQKIRGYKSTQLTVDPSGFEVAVEHEEPYREVKIDLPDSWVRGFLQVSSAMTLPATHLRLHPMDIHNICLLLRRQHERHGPRSIRWRLQPGQPLELVFEPWGKVLRCPRTICEVTEPQEIRMWGRRRLQILERLIPLAKHFDVHLLGTGMPAFFVADLGPMKFTLGLSGWTANDWSQSGNFDLLAPRAEVDELTSRRIFSALQETWQESATSLGRRLGLAAGVVMSGLTAYVQAGRVVYDLPKQVYRIRELYREPLPIDRLRYANPREEAAARFVTHNLVTLDPPIATNELSGTVLDNAREFSPQLRFDDDDRIIDGQCTCHFYHQNKLYKGPCEHMLAIRLAADRNRLRPMNSDATAASA